MSVSREQIVEATMNMTIKTLKARLFIIVGSIGGFWDELDDIIWIYNDNFRKYSL
jgi:hypothetical protein